ncbi:MAG TPA: formylglycine-generating enzyme family protein [Verrucomicrobiae bacterium]|nr:formylglycine-generating enzyme family protein [Verrucomicrobiae bacterium]
MKRILFLLAILPGALTAASRNGPALSTNIYQLITSRAAGVTEAAMAAYTNTIPGTNISYAMAPIRGGEFRLGSPATEPGRKSDEGPQRRARIEPFWMGISEVTWNEYEIFLFRARGMRTYMPSVDRDPRTNTLADAVALPSMPYIEPSMGMGREGYPAINMTQHAANKYCQWLSALTGHYYRLPTEAEWEYACRAGTTTRYSFGDDEKQLSEYAWFENNSDYKYQRVMRKKPNPWGLYDMHGNVAEWTLDGYNAGAYGTFPDGALAPFIRGVKSYPHAVRGGSWKDDAANLRSASRQFSVPKWEEADPDLPKSVWHMVEADFVGFRIVRPLRIPNAEEVHRAWNNGVEIE